MTWNFVRFFVRTIYDAPEVTENRGYGYGYLFRVFQYFVPVTAPEKRIPPYGISYIPVCRHYGSGSARTERKFGLCESPKHFFGTKFDVSIFF